MVSQRQPGLLNSHKELNFPTRFALALGEEDIASTFLPLELKKPHG
jgi:hypothetical protein